MSKQNFLGGSSPVVLESSAPVVVAVSLCLCCRSIFKLSHPFEMQKPLSRERVDAVFIFLCCYLNAGGTLMVSHSLVWEPMRMFSSMVL